MDDEVDMQRSPGTGRNPGLQRIVQTPPPVDGARWQDPHPLEDPEDVHVDGKHVATEAVHQHAARALPGQAVQAEKLSLGFQITQAVKVAEREPAGVAANLLEQPSNRPGFLSMQPAKLQCRRQGALACTQ